jgi:hypothetical protein
MAARATATRQYRHLTSIGAGLVGGAVFLVVELVFLPITNHLPADWILRLISSLMAGPIALTHPAGQIGGLLITALAVHAALSTSYALVLCRMEDELSVAGSIAASALMGFAIYLVNFYLMTFVFPWFASARGGATIAAHVLFGVTTALAHKGLRGLRGVSARPRPTQEPTPPAAQPARSSARS